MHDPRTATPPGCKRSLHDRGTAFALVVAMAPVFVACHPGVDPPGVPLYPNAATARLPRNQVAQLYGPIAKVDDQEVTGQAGPFDVLPGCHIVELDRHVVADSYGLSSGAYWSGGGYPQTVYALRTKAAARYVIQRTIVEDSAGMGRVRLSAREEEANGATADLMPAESGKDLLACKDWQPPAAAP